MDSNRGPDPHLRCGPLVLASGGVVEWWSGVNGPSNFYRRPYRHGRRHSHRKKFGTTSSSQRWRLATGHSHERSNVSLASFPMRSWRTMADCGKLPIAFRSRVARRLDGMRQCLSGYGSSGSRRLRACRRFDRLQRHRTPLSRSNIG